MPKDWRKLELTEAEFSGERLTLSDEKLSILSICTWKTRYSVERGFDASVKRWEFMKCVRNENGMLET